MLSRFLHLVLLLAISGGFLVAVAQSSLIREDHPLAVKIGFEGFGLDYCLGNRLGIDFTTFAFLHSAKTRYLVLNRNTTPYIGLGVGSFPGYWSTSEANKWFELHAGWEHRNGMFIIQLFLQKTIIESNTNSHVPFVFGINFGMRVS